MCNDLKQNYSNPKTSMYSVLLNANYKTDLQAYKFGFPSILRPRESAVIGHKEHNRTVNAVAAIGLYEYVFRLRTKGNYYIRSHLQICRFRGRIGGLVPACLL